MSLSEAVAGRSRNVDVAHAFFPVPVESGTFAKPSSTPSPSSYGWKLAHLNRIWKKNGPKGSTAKSVLTVLWRHSDDKGRTWIGLPLLADEAGVGNLRTVRSALERLVQTGWLHYAPQTWSSLTAEQQAAGRPVPRRDNAGQAPNLYELLDGRGQPVTPTRPGLVRTSTASSDEHPPDKTLEQNCPGGPEQIGPGEPRAKLPYDPDLSGSVHKEVSEEGAASAPSTHDFSKALEGKGDWGWLESWQLVVQAHASKTKGVYGLAPMEPDMKQGERKAIGECLDGASTEVAAKLRSRGMEREIEQLRKDLAERAVALYFRNDTPHLRKTKHALRDLPREFHARITEAMQGILRESHDDAKSPRQTVLLEHEQTVRPKAEKAAEVAKIEAAEKPIPQAIAANTAREARRIMEVLNGTPSREEPSKPCKAEASRATRPTQEQARTEPRQLQEAKHGANGPQTIQRSIGRPGAPRWGALGPTPAKMRRVSRLQVAEPEEATESAEPHPRE